jgi:soluble lytic murein transglycosylase-like protein
MIGALQRASEGGLVLAALLGVGVATWRLRTAAAAPTTAATIRAPRAPTERELPATFPYLGRAAAPPAGSAQDPARPPADPLLAALRSRVRRGDSRVPAVAVDRWILRLLSDAELRAGMDDALGRMSRYEPLIRETLRRNGEPEELLYLVIVESEFRENAVSRAGAAGMWQFMTGTGRTYDLEVSEYVDERRDPIRSTEAAARHLADLHREFGSWHLALAAYNAGSGRVGALLRRYAWDQRGDEALYWRIRGHLPRETRDYVPLYLAAAEIARRPQAFGIHPRRLPPLTFSERWVPGGVALEAVARDVGAPVEALRQLNPHLIRGMTPPGRRWPVRVPVA